MQSGSRILRVKEGEVEGGVAGGSLAPREADRKFLSIVTRVSSSLHQIFQKSG